MATGRATDELHAHDASHLVCDKILVKIDLVRMMSLFRRTLPALKSLGRSPVCDHLETCVKTGVPGVADVSSTSALMGLPSGPAANLRSQRGHQCL